MAILLCSCGAIGQTNITSFDELMSNALHSLVFDSSAKLESYRFSAEMEQKIDLVNLSLELASLPSGDTQRLCTRSFGYGMANMTDRALKLSVAHLTYAEGDEDNSSATTLDEYLINDTVYLKVDGNWIVMKVPAWDDSTYTMTQQLKMFNQSRLSLIGSEMVEGQDCYKVQAVMVSTLADQLSGDVASPVPMQSINHSYYWITKDTHLLKKLDVLEIFTLNSQSFGLPANGSEGQEMRVNAETTMLFEGFNESVNIKLPAEAEKAQPFPMASAEAVPVIPAGNESKVNETMLNETMLESSTAQATVTA